MTSLRLRIGLLVSRRSTLKLATALSHRQLHTAQLNNQSRRVALPTFVVSRRDSPDGTSAAGYRPFIIQILSAVIPYGFGPDGSVGSGQFTHPPGSQNVAHFEHQIEMRRRPVM